VHAQILGLWVTTNTENSILAGTISLPEGAAVSSGQLVPAFTSTSTSRKRQVSSVHCS